jgi:DNA modification methylase
MPPMETTTAIARAVHGDCLDVMPKAKPGGVDSIVTDPPYGLSFMGREWDHGVPGVPFWQAALHPVKPGGYLLAFGGTRTFHRLTCAIEDAGWEIRDCVLWLYGTGFPKAKSCLKPAWEPIVVARKPGPSVLPLGIDECRIPDVGRWPANVVHDGGDEVAEAFAAFGEFRSTKRNPKTCVSLEENNQIYGRFEKRTYEGNTYGDSGSAARFFYSAKASKADRRVGLPDDVANKHPTVKPLKLVEWLLKLVTPEGGTALDPFGGSGTLIPAAKNAGRRAVVIEKTNTDAEPWHELCRLRAEWANNG